MKIMILTMGSRGDVQPCVALGKGLRAAGHIVSLATGEMFHELVTENGLSLMPIDDEMIRLTETPEGRQIVESGSSLKAIALVKPMQKRMMADSWQAAQDFQPDLIIYHPKALAGYHLAEKLGIPAILSLVLPLYTPTAAFPIPMTGKNMGGWLNKQSYKMVSMIGAPYNDVINNFRQDLGLAKVGRFFNETTLPDGRSMPTLYGFSHHVVPRPDDWPDTAVASGYWFLDQTAVWQSPADLTAFLAAGPAPVYIGFGSMAGKYPGKLAHIAVQALQQTGQRGVLATGWGGLQPSHLPDTIFQLKQAPHDWLFPRMAAVVHHGGSGTTAAGLRAGRPTVICPFLGDQPFWGARVRDLGVGPAPIPQKKLTVENLAALIHQATSTTSMQEKAANLGAKLQAEDSIGQALQFISRVMAGETKALA